MQCILSGYSCTGLSHDQAARCCRIVAASSCSWRRLIFSNLLSGMQNSGVRTWPVLLQLEDMLLEELIAEPCNRYGGSYTCTGLQEQRRHVGATQSGCQHQIR